VWPDGSTLWLHERPGGSDAGDAALAVSGAHQLHTPHRRIEADRPVEALVAIARDLDRP
jgi:hypothetical protein